MATEHRSIDMPLAAAVFGVAVFLGALVLRAGLEEPAVPYQVVACPYTFPPGCTEDRMREIIPLYPSPLRTAAIGAFALGIGTIGLTGLALKWTIPRDFNAAPAENPFREMERERARTVLALLLIAAGLALGIGGFLSASTSLTCREIVHYGIYGNVCFKIAISPGSPVGIQVALVGGIATAGGIALLIRGPRREFHPHVS